MHMTDRSEFEGAYIEVENGEVRYYCRSRLDGIRTGILVKKYESDVVSVSFYDGVTDVEEMSSDDSELMLTVLRDPNVQRIMAIFGGQLVGVERIKPGED